MFAVIFVPEFPLQAPLRGQPGGQPTVVIDDEAARRGTRGKAPVVAMNAQASLAGVHGGMTATQAQARCGGLRVLTRDRVQEQAVFHEMIDAVLEHFADVEATRGGLVTTDLHGCRPGSNGWTVFGETIRRELSRKLRMDLVMAIAPTADLASLLAASLTADGGSLRILERTDQAAAHLDGEPIQRLRPSPGLAELLDLWGVRTIGQFLSLPESEVAERLGEEAVAWREIVGGRRPRLLRLVRPPRSYEQMVELEYELDTLEPLLFLLRRSLEMLTARLTARYLVTSRIRLELLGADGRRRRETLRVPDPANDVDLLFRLVQRRLETLIGNAAVTGFSLALTPHQPRKRQFDFFRSALNDPNRFSHTLAELESLLGPDRVGRPRSLDTHRPDAFRLEAFDRSMEEASHDALQSLDIGCGDASGDSWGAVTLGLPLHRCRPPLPVEVKVATDRREGVAAPARLLDGPFPGPIVDAAGPWKASGAWWEPEAWSREEWDIQLREGLLCRLVRRGGEWYLEGLYG